MTTRRRWTDNRPFQAKQWRKIAHILDSYSARSIQQISGTMGRRSTNKKSLGYSEEKFEVNHLQELRYFNQRRVMQGLLKSINFDSVVGLG